MKKAFKDLTKVSFRIWIARKIARTMLFIKATTYRKLTEEPYKWASGMLMRIYNDNRMMLAEYSHRLRITEGFRYLLKSKKIHPDYIIGTSTSGIAPAAALAQSMGIPLLIYNEGKYFIYEGNIYFSGMSITYPEPNTVISTSPFAIPYGVNLANWLKIGFAYVRKQKKDHGKEKTIEGIVRPGDSFVFIHNDESLMDVSIFLGVIEEALGLKHLLTTKAHKKPDEISSELLKGKIAVVAEDLFSTGGSAAMEVYNARQAGMICNHCFSIFSYGFDCLKRQFTGEDNIGNTELKLSQPCEIDSLLTFAILIEEIMRLKFYPPEIIEAMVEEIGGFDERYKLFLAEKASMV